MEQTHQEIEEIKVGINEEGRGRQIAFFRVPEGQVREGSLGMLPVHYVRNL